MIAVDLEEDESETFPTDIDFRQISIIRDPLENDTEDTDAENTVYDMTTTLTMDTVYDPIINGDYVQDEQVYQGADLTSATATGIVVNWTPATAGQAGSVLRINNIIGDFDENESVIGVNSGAVYTPGTITDRGLKYSGSVLYVDNRSKITRDDEQTEEIRILLSF